MKTKESISVLLKTLLLVNAVFLISCDSNPPSSVYSSYADAVKEYMIGDNEAALLIFKDIHREYPRFTEASLFYGRALFYEGQYSEVILCLEDILKNNVNIDSSKILARSYLIRQEIVKAEAVLTKVLQYSSQDPELLFLKARCRIALEDPEAALSLLKTACALMEKQIEIPLELASLYSRYGLYDEAAGLIKQYMNILEPENPLRSSIEILNRELQNKTEKKSAPQPGRIQ